MQKLDKIAIVGATGLVGRLTLEILLERNFPAQEITVLASKKSEGVKLDFGSNKLEVKCLEGFDFSGYDLVIFCLPTDAAKKYVPIAVEAGCIVIDNSNHYRTDPEVPLVVPEINCHTIGDYKNKNIIANANCATIQMLMAVAPLHKVNPVKRIVVATYQSVSGAGYFPMEELPVAVQHDLNNKNYKTQNYPRDIAFNVIPQVDALTKDGRSIEEWKLQHDTNRILGEKVPVSASCARVPVEVGHTEAVNLEFTKEISVNEVKEILANAKGVIVKEKDEDYITAKEIAGTDEVYVSRIRKDHTIEYGINFWVMADNLRKGAALNTVQIAECWLEYINQDDAEEESKKPCNM